MIRLLTAAAVTLALLTPAAPTHAATPGCVVVAEAAQVRPGMTTAKVARITGTWGKVRRINYRTRVVVRSYRVCKGYSRDAYFAVAFKRGKVIQIAGKFANRGEPA